MRIEKRESSLRTAANKVKNPLAATGVVLVGVGATALIFLGKDCAVEGPLRPNPNDGIGLDIEAFTFKMDKNFRPLKGRDGKDLPNPWYSERDVGYADGRCSKNESADPADENFSIDCLRIRCGNPEKVPTIEEDDLFPTAEMLKLHCIDVGFEQEDGSLPCFYLQVRLPEELQEMHDHPEKVAKGNNYVVRLVAHQETCDENEEPCDGNSKARCFCANHRKCLGPEFDLVFEEPETKQPVKSKRPVKVVSDDPCECRSDDDCAIGRECVSCKCVPIAVAEHVEEPPQPVGDCKSKVTSHTHARNLKRTAITAFESAIPGITKALEIPGGHGFRGVMKVFVKGDGSTSVRGTSASARYEDAEGVIQTKRADVSGIVSTRELAKEPLPRPQNSKGCWFNIRWTRKARY